MGEGGKDLVNRSRGIRTCIMGNILEPKQQPHRKHHVTCKIGRLEAFVLRSKKLGKMF